MRRRHWLFLGVIGVVAAMGLNGAGWPASASAGGGSETRGHVPVAAVLSSDVDRVEGPQGDGSGIYASGHPVCNPAAWYLRCLGSGFKCNDCNETCGAHCAETCSSLLDELICLMECIYEALGCVDTAAGTLASADDAASGELVFPLEHE